MPIARQPPRRTAELLRVLRPLHTFSHTTRRSYTGGARVTARVARGALLASLYLLISHTFAPVARSLLDFCSECDCFSFRADFTFSLFPFLLRPVALAVFSLLSPFEGPTPLALIPCRTFPCPSHPPPQHCPHPCGALAAHPHALSSGRSRQATRPALLARPSSRFALFIHIPALNCTIRRSYTGGARVTARVARGALLASLYFF